MSGSYRVLAAIGLVAALAVAFAARHPHAPRVAPTAVAAPAPVRDIALVVRDGALSPDPVVAPKGARVRLTVSNTGAAPVRFTLTGYEAHVRALGIAPGATWTATFTADLPGSDFAFLVDGRPAGRFDVTGSHLVEGHQ